MSSAQRKATLEDLHAIASGMPHAVRGQGGRGQEIYWVGQKSFIILGLPKVDAFDPATGERLRDVIVFRVPSEGDKAALLQDGSQPYFTTPHFDRGMSVLIRASRLGELSRAELTELIQEAWLSCASARRAAAWLRHHELR
ncbi:hypothetical protein [Microlunatus speluncae]|uniref:hypothetical protein n=1 Tax=Microlunatus speluncae TaxID=2594267 RepID=UPI0012666F4E|nr:hypothetical protein [Microlunatus speluncae]